MQKHHFFKNSRGAVSMTNLLFVALTSFILWAAFFEIEQTVRAQGQVIPIARTQVIQSADGGVLEKLLVEEGQHVKIGQQLAVLERERSTATGMSREEQVSRKAATSSCQVVLSKSTARNRQVLSGSSG